MKLRTETEMMNMPMDLLMSAMIPFHGHLGMRLVLVDYVPDPSVHNVAMILLWIITVLAAIGLLKVTFTGPGITESFRYLWKKPISHTHDDQPKKT